MCDHLSPATTSHNRPPIQNTQIFPVEVLQLKPSSKRPPSVSDLDHFLGLTVNVNLL